MKARTSIFVILAAFIAVFVSAEESSDGKAAFKAKCAACHGEDGKGETNYGKKRQIRDLASEEIQSESDKDLARHATECGKDVSREEARALVRVIRALAPPAAPPPPRAIPEVTIADAHPQACVSCHVVMPDIGIDARISTLLTRLDVEVEPRLLSRAQAVMDGGHALTGRHPSVADALANIPAACIDCHDAAPDAAPRFSQLMHVIHLTGGNENHFLSIFQGECTHCHKLTAATGRWTVPSGKEQ